ncbi:hypothetical protein PCASD_21991 [Puccinia coronata f. sp. avenae]|uniref:Uncharacterized protein n=1 Tax=Puccinia coronata f. sp. avenae TaxID=200324 RepID=A0A2N5U3A5_9BASI|nr:hypothetical protein PCASD_21991 [Puccinia coronata f. sp. avenae]
MAQELVKNFDKLFYDQMKDHAAYPPSVYFSITQACNIQKLIGSETIPGQMAMLVKDEDEDNKKNKARQKAWEAAALKKAEISARVAANAERKCVASEARLTSNKKNQANKESNMATLQELKAQARNNQTLASSSDQASTSRAVNESIDPSLFHS